MANVMEVTSSVIRSCIIAPPGKKLVVADLSNIEGRILAWLAGETWKINAFYEFDAGIGHDLYKIAYSKSFGVSPEDVTKDQRQVGKVQELALGYEGGVGAFLTFAAAYGLDLDAMAEQGFEAIPQSIINEARSAFAWHKLNHRTTHNLKEKTWVVCDSFKRSWRYAHPNVVEFWHDLQSAAIAAVNRPGKNFKAGPIIARRDGAWLRLRLPSGRFLCYPSPAIEDGKLTYMGVNQYSRKWERLITYGGKLVENATQAAARDVMAHGMVLAETEGYDIILTVHDELITETPDTEEFNVAKLSAVMATTPPWAQGLPLAAAGYESLIYKKD